MYFLSLLHNLFLSLHSLDLKALALRQNVHPLLCPHFLFNPAHPSIFQHSHLDTVLATTQRLLFPQSLSPPTD